MASLLLRNIPKTRFHFDRTSPFFTNLSRKSAPINHPSAALTHPRLCSTKKDDRQKQCETPVSLQQKLKKAVAEYGSTVIVFHVSISLVSLGVCYLSVSSGLDVGRLMEPLGLNGETVTKVATNAGTFAVAYAVHKVFAPVRIMITLTATPFIVRYLRQIGVLKKSLK